MFTTGASRPVVLNGSLETFFGCHNWWGRGRDFHLVGRGSTAYKHPTGHRTAPATEDYPAPNTNGAQVKKLCSMEKGIQVYCIIYFFQLFCRFENARKSGWGVCVEDPYGFAKCLGVLKMF